MDADNKEYRSQRPDPGRVGGYPKLLHHHDKRAAGQLQPEVSR